MTYCVALNVQDGLVLCADSRTSAGPDNISMYSKLFRFTWPGERFIALMSAGNLGTTQAVIHRLEQDISAGAQTHLGNVASMYDAADYVGQVSAFLQGWFSQRNPTGNATNFQATFLLAGQIAGQRPETYLIYPEGNFIREPEQGPYLQIGEFKYGKPILDRVITRSLPLAMAARCALMSMNSSVRSNLTVGPPIELLIYRCDAFDGGWHRVFSADDPFLERISRAWNDGLVELLEQLPPLPWEETARKD